MSFLLTWGATLNWAKTLGDQLYLYRRVAGQLLPDVDIPHLYGCEAVRHKLKNSLKNKKVHFLPVLRGRVKVRSKFFGCHKE